MKTNPLNHRGALIAALATLGMLAPALARAGEDQIEPDRPDFVDSSKVVDKGRLQLETGFNVERQKDGGERERTSSTPVLLRVGVGSGLELRAQTDGRMRYRLDSADSLDREHGWADAVVGAKWHLTDGGGAAPALALIGETALRTGSPAFRGSDVRQSVRVAAEWELADDLSLGIMPGVIRDRNDDGSTAVKGLFAISLGKDWSERLHSFVEVAAPRIARVRHGGTEATFDVGGSWLLSTNLQVDAAVSRGLNRRSADVSWTVGLSGRL